MYNHKFHIWMVLLSHELIRCIYSLFSLGKIMFFHILHSNGFFFSWTLKMCFSSYLPPWNLSSTLIVIRESFLNKNVHSALCEMILKRASSIEKGRRFLVCEPHFQQPHSAGGPPFVFQNSWQKRENYDPDLKMNAWDP